MDEDRRLAEIEKMHDLLKIKGFSFFGDAFVGFPYQDSKLISYGDWQIYLDIPNGGILAVDIIHRKTGGWWGYPTRHIPRQPVDPKFPCFDYDDDEGVINFAKKIICEVEEQLGIAKLVNFECVGQSVPVYVKFQDSWVWVSWCPDGLKPGNYCNPEFDGWYEAIASAAWDLMPDDFRKLKPYLDSAFEACSGGFHCRVNTEIELRSSK